MLRNNICTADGLVNGVVGTIVGFEYPDGAREPGVQPSGMNIIFDNPRVGRESRGSDEHIPVMSQPVTARFNGRDGRHRFERYQFPVCLA